MLVDAPEPELQRDLSATTAQIDVVLTEEKELPNPPIIRGEAGSRENVSGTAVWPHSPTEGSTGRSSAVSGAATDSCPTDEPPTDSGEVGDGKASPAAVRSASSSAAKSSAKPDDAKPDAKVYEGLEVRRVDYDCAQLRWTEQLTRPHVGQ